MLMSFLYPQAYEIPCPRRVKKKTVIYELNTMCQTYSP